MSERERLIEAARNQMDRALSLCGNMLPSDAEPIRPVVLGLAAICNALLAGLEPEECMVCTADGDGTAGGSGEDE